MRRYFCRGRSHCIDPISFLGSLSDLGTVAVYGSLVHYDTILAYGSLNFWGTVSSPLARPISSRVSRSWQRNEMFMAGNVYDWIGKRRFFFEVDAIPFVMQVGEK